MLYQGENPLELSQKAALLLLILIEAKGNLVSFETIQSRL